MKVAVALTLFFLAVPAVFFVRNLFTTLRGKTRGAVAWVVWLWLGLWGAALAYGIASAVPRWIVSGEGSIFLAFGVAAVSVFCQVRLWGHFMGRTTYAPHGEETVVRGTEVVDGGSLQARMYGDSAKPADIDIEVGGVVIPRMLEAQHMLFSGTTGAGKTQAINRVLRAVRKRGQRALIADPAGGFYSRFARPGDVLFNPFDGRSVDWSPFAEIRHDYDCQRIAKAAVPDGTGEGAEWHHYAQTLLGETLLVLHQRGEHSVKRLLHYISAADTKELGELLAGTPAAILTAKGNDKMLNNTRGIIATYLGVWRYLPDSGRFSVRSWVQDEGGDGWLFVTYRDDQMGLLRGLVASLLELGIVEGLSLSENQDRGLWFVFDEVDSLGKVSSLRSGLTKLRKYGGRVVLGLQTVSQLRETYGKDEAQTLLANLSTKLILRAGDNETAEYFSKELGEQDIDRLQMTSGHGSSTGGMFNPGQSSQSANTNFNMLRVRQAVIMSSEVLNLPDMHGFLKIPGQPVGEVQVGYQAMEEVQPAFQG